MVYKFTYSFYIILILLSIPVQFVVIILLSHAMTLLQTRPYDLQWIEFIGEHAARWLKPFVRDTPWESGISVWNQFTYFPVCLIVSSFLLLFLKVVSEWCIEYLSEKVASDIRNSLIKNYLTLNFMDALKTDKGALGTRIAEDTHEARLALTRVLGSIPAQVLSSVFFITWLVLLDTQLFFLFVSILTPSIFIIRWVSKLLKGLSKQGLNSQSLLHDSLLEKLTHWQTIRTFGAYQLELERFSKDNTNLYKIWRRATRAKSLSTPLVEWLATMAGCCVIVVALKRISENALSQNAFTSFLVTVSYLAASLQEISTQITHSRKGAESWRRLFLFGLFAQNSQKTIFPQGEKNKNDLEEKDRISVIKLDNVQLENLNKNSLVTEDLFENPINLELKKGDFCAIYGPSGIGKTSFITALIGLTPIKSGHILWSTPHKILPLNDLNFKLIHYNLSNFI